MPDEYVHISDINKAIRRIEEEIKIADEKGNEVYADGVQRAREILMEEHIG